MDDEELLDQVLVPNTQEDTTSFFKSLIGRLNLTRTTRDRQLTHNEASTSTSIVSSKLAVEAINREIIEPSRLNLKG